MLAEGENWELRSSLQAEEVKSAREAGRILGDVYKAEGPGVAPALSARIPFRQSNLTCRLHSSLIRLLSPRPMITYASLWWIDTSFC